MSVETSGEERQGHGLIVSVVVGTVVAVIVAVIPPVSPLVGGALAGFIYRGRGSVAGFFVGLLASVPTFLTSLFILPILGVLGFTPAFGYLMLLGYVFVYAVVIWIVIGAVLGALGGLLGSIVAKRRGS